MALTLGVNLLRIWPQPDTSLNPQESLCRCSRPLALLLSLLHRTDRVPELFSQAPEREEAPFSLPRLWTPPPPDPGDSTSFHSIKELLNVKQYVLSSCSPCLDIQPRWIFLICLLLCDYWCVPFGATWGSKPIQSRGSLVHCMVMKTALVECD